MVATAGQRVMGRQACALRAASRRWVSLTRSAEQRMVWFVMNEHCAGCDVEMTCPKVG